MTDSLIIQELRKWLIEPSTERTVALQVAYRNVLRKLDELEAEHFKQARATWDAEACRMLLWASD